MKRMCRAILPATLGDAAGWAPGATVKPRQLNVPAPRSYRSHADRTRDQQHCV